MTRPTADANPAVKLTLEDYRAIPEDGLRHEVLDGEHVVSPAPRRAHQQVCTALTARMFTAIQDRGLGEVFAAPFDLLLGETDIVQPDLLVVVTAHASRIHEDGVHGAPDLVVEVLSASTRDRDLGAKMERYAVAGVPEYWVVDPDARELRQFALLDAGYELRGVRTDRVQAAFLPEVVIDLRTVWTA